MASNPEEITPDLVRSLVAAQFPYWSRLAVEPVPCQGLDYRTFRLGDDMTVRLPSADGYVAGLVREERTLSILRSRIGVAIPRVLATGAPSAAFARPWSVRGWIAGHTLADVPRVDRAVAIAAVADALAELHACDAEGGPWAGRASAYRGCHVSAVGDDVQQALSGLPEGLKRGCRELWERAVGTVLTGAPAWVHGDVAPGNLLFDGAGRLAALIDFGQTCVGDPACDLGFAWLSCASDERTVLRERLGAARCGGGYLAAGRGLGALEVPHQLRRGRARDIRSPP